MSQHWPRIPSWWQHFDLLDFPKPFSIIELDKILATCTFLNVQSRNSTCLDISSLFPKFAYLNYFQMPFWKVGKMFLNWLQSFFQRSTMGKIAKVYTIQFLQCYIQWTPIIMKKTNWTWIWMVTLMQQPLKTLTPLAPKK